MEDALALGRANVETIELARRHCLNMAFSDWAGAGHGMAEAVSGLPIDSRQVHCPYARGGAAMDLGWIASEFYEAHCVGCPHRRPTGEVPNLATFMEVRKAEAAADAEARRAAIERRHGHWQERIDQRRALIAQADPAMAKALDDIGTLDTEPGADFDVDARNGALRRVTALAERAPDAFTPAVVALAVKLVEHERITDLLTPLRRLVHIRTDLAPAVAAAAIATLRRSPIVEAGRCVADLSDHIDPSTIDHDVVRTLVLLASAPSDDLLGRRRPSVASDPTGLRAAAKRVPDTVVRVLRGLLPPPQPLSSLIVAPSAGGRPVRQSSDDYERFAAAGAVRALADTHPAVATQLVGDLVRSLAVDEERYDLHALGSVQHALAVLFVLDVGDVFNELEAAGKLAGDVVCQRLFGVLEQTARLLDPNDRWREPGDPQPTDSRRRALFDRVMGISVVRVGGDWGEETGYRAAKLIAQLAAMEPAWAHPHLDAFFGAFLTTTERLNVVSEPKLTVVDTTPPQLRALEAMSRRTGISAAARELLEAVERLAVVDVGGVCAAITVVMADERDTERGPDALWRLLPLLGKIGRRHGGEPGVLQAILPTLHTYLVDTDVALRSAALDAWVEIGSRHRVPSSLADLLPALLVDPYLAVIRGLLAAARRLTWSENDRDRLLVHAWGDLEGVDGKHVGTLKDAMATVSALTRDDERLRPHGEALILQRARELDGYDLRDALARSWLPDIRGAAGMATLRLRQARDPQINDRFNASDDEELCALLECGGGLAALLTDDLAAAALDLAPDYPIGSAEFAEVAWRADRPDDAAAIMRVVLEATPRQPAYDVQRALAQLVMETATFDVIAKAGGDLEPAARSLAAAVAAIGSEPSDLRDDLARQVRARAAARRIFLGREPSTGIGDENGAEVALGRRDPAAAARARAAALAAVSQELEQMSQRVTPTGAYLRAYAGLCEVGVHLLRFDAAQLDADWITAAAESTAARRRAAVLEAELVEAFGPLDPLAGPLATVLGQVGGIASGADVADAVAAWAALPVPLLIVRGPRRARRSAPIAATANAAEAPSQPVAVVLASVNGHLITGPLVLRPSTVYELRLDVRLDEWPEWADRLDAEIISHLTRAEAETPTLSWPRPAPGDANLRFVGDGPLVLRFGLGAGQPAPPFLISLRWRGARDGDARTEVLDVAGHCELRLRPFDASRDYLTDYRMVDERLIALYDQLQRAGYDEDQLQAFCRLFSAACRAGLEMTWDKDYKRGAHVSERKFHDDLYERLLAEPELAGRLERGSPLGLGFLDVRHDGITAELKVERATPVSEATAPKYMGQPTQYAAADGARLSILCVLDMSPKGSPIGTAENYIFTLRPALHGLENPEAPSLVAVIVVNANLPPPSSWSRRKVAALPDIAAE